MSPHIRTVKTASGARAVQVVYSKRGGRREMEHVGSAHTDAEYEALLVTARQRMVGGQPELDLGLSVPKAAVLPITSSRMGVLWDLLEVAWQRIGFDSVVDGADGDVFRKLVLARIIEPTSKLDAARVLDEAGISAPSYPTIKPELAQGSAPSRARRQVGEPAPSV